MTLIGCLEGLTSQKPDGTQLGDIKLKELGTYSSLKTYEVWIRSNGLKPLTSEAPDIPEADAATLLLSSPTDKSITGGMKVLVFHNWRDSKTEDGAKAKVIRDALSYLDLPAWLPARFFTHSFFVDPANRSMSNSRPSRRYWQRFRGGLLLWTYQVSNHTTRAVFLCREEQYWTAFKQNLQHSLEYAALPVLPGVLAYIQQVKVSVSYIYWVRERINGILKEVENNLVIVDTMPGQKGRNLKEEKLMHEQLARVESHIWELVRCAQEAAGAVPYLTDNSGNLKRILSSLEFVKAENEAYRQAIKGGKLGTSLNPELLANQAEELSGVIDDLTVELNSQSLAADWIATKINALIQNTNLTINRADQKLNLLIADSSLTIAVESRRDNLSMVTIAAITMIFLPGTFVASFFAMPLLDWNATHEDAVVTDRFWIYWAVTIPLTVAVILCWLTFFWRKDFLKLLHSLNVSLVRQRRNRKDAEASHGTANSTIQHGAAVTIASTGEEGSLNNIVKLKHPKKTPTSEYRMAPNQRIDWSNKDSSIAPMRYAA